MSMALSGEGLAGSLYSCESSGTVCLRECMCVCVDVSDCVRSLDVGWIGLQRTFQKPLTFRLDEKKWPQAQQAVAVLCMCEVKSRRESAFNSKASAKRESIVPFSS